MYQYTAFDRQFVHQRAAQFRDQLTRWQKGKLSEDDFRPLRLQNGWYVQRYAPMLANKKAASTIQSACIRCVPPGFAALSPTPLQGATPAAWQSQFCGVCLKGLQTPYWYGRKAGLRQLDK